VTAHSGRGGTGNRRYRRNRALMLATNDTCALCGHGGAQTADHIIPAKFWPKGPDGKPLPGLNDPGNLQPAHGSMGSGTDRVVNRCTVCGKLCNQSKGAGRRPQRQGTRDWYGTSAP
jgi:5-methylcytosine-specific restriction endonuclease McrA